MGVGHGGGVLHRNTIWTTDPAMGSVDGTNTAVG